MASKKTSDCSKINIIDDAIITINYAGEILTWNTGATKLYGYQAKEITGQSLRVLFPKNRSNEFNRILKCIQKNHLTRILEINLIHKNGRLLDVSLTNAPISLEGKIVGACIIAYDISSLKKTHMQTLHYERKASAAQEASNLKSQFIANVSHELRTPLNGIIGFAELMYDGHVNTDTPKHKEFLANILSCAKQLLLLLNDVLDLTKIQAGKMQFHTDTLIINKITKEIQDTFLSTTQEKNINIKFEIDNNLGNIITDTDKLKQILYNYISNALKFSALNSEIIVRFKHEKKDMFRIEVEDTGIGIKEADLKKLFMEFQQIDSSSSKQYQGTGLGLALTKTLVEAQGGFVGVESIFGKGSLFYACLPCFPKTKQQNTNPKSNTYETLKPVKKRLEQILVIEPESFERMLLIDSLRQLGFKVKVASDFAEAMKVFKDSKLDAIVLNMAFQPLTYWESIHKLVAYSNQGSQKTLLATVDVCQTLNSELKIIDFILKTSQPSEILSAIMASINYIDPNEKNKTVLILDTDETAINRAKLALNDFGFNVIACQNSGSALASLMENRPSAILLDPFLANHVGLDLLYKLRQIERGMNTPIIIWTTTNLTEEVKLRLKSSLDRLVLSNFDRQENLLMLLSKRLQQQRLQEEEVT